MRFYLLLHQIHHTTKTFQTTQYKTTHSQNKTCVQWAYDFAGEHVVEVLPHAHHTCSGPKGKHAGRPSNIVGKISFVLENAIMWPDIAGMVQGMGFISLGASAAQSFAAGSTL